MNISTYTIDEETIQKLADHICQVINYAKEMYEHPWGWDFVFEYKNIKLTVYENLTRKETVKLIRVSRRDSWLEKNLPAFFFNDDVGESIGIETFTPDQQASINDAFRKQKKIIQNRTEAKKLENFISYFR